jgi:hypothetical protein
MTKPDGESHCNTNIIFTVTVVKRNLHEGAAGGGEGEIGGGGGTLRGGRRKAGGGGGWCGVYTYI